MRVEAKNAEYLTATCESKDEPSEAEESWILAVQEQYNKAERETIEYKKSICDDDSRQDSQDVLSERKKAERMHKLEGVTLMSQIEVLKTILSVEDAAAETIKEALSDVNLQFGKYKQMQRELILLADETEIEVITAELQKLQLVCTNIKIKAGKVIAYKANPTIISKDAT